MLQRIRSLNLVPRNDALLVLGLGLLIFGFAAVWSVVLADSIFRQFRSSTPNNFLMLLVLIGFAAVATIVPWFTWGRNETRKIARAMVRFGISIQVFAVLITPVGLYFETDPVIAVPIGYASFLAMFLGVFVAGFGGNMLAPPRA
jgi:uncharacterized membrane protein